MHDPAPADNRPSLTHLDARGAAHMVDVSAKPPAARAAVAEAVVRLTHEVRDRLFQGDLPKGEALAVARIAGIQAAKATPQLIPLCHPLALSRVAVDFAPAGDDAVAIRAECRTVGPTGVEMEALTAAAVAALTVYDMVKGVCREAVIERVQLLHKSGGRSGSWDRPGTGPAGAPR
ncbi:MAG: cyclic pyranopterin monophosphate synthase MoaC [Planctomycetes bacterium]|nr:cyclic pyranopterin monophosphate synthase MoaC [Planctomycetota bacterium]